MLGVAHFGPFGTTPMGHPDTFAKRWRDSYPPAMRSLCADRDSLTVYPRFPRALAADPPL
jgi:hypothetical protein